MGNAAVALATRARLASSSALPSSLARAAHRRRRHRRSRRRAVPDDDTVGVARVDVDVDIARRGMTREVTRVGSYALKQTLGKGAFGWVKLGVQDKTGVKVAVKILDRENLQHLDEQDQVKAEVKAMAELTHPCIVDLREVLSNERCVFMVMQYCPGGELYDIVRVQGALDESTARRHFQRLIQGVDFCHKKRIYHRDLKPENLFLDERGDLCIGDFGLAALRQDADDNNLRTICGTPHFAAPEVMGGSRRLVGNKNFKTVNTHTRAHGYDGRPADVWSCGCILYYFLTGKFPFDGKNFVQLQLMVQKTEPYFTGAVSRQVEKLIRGMLVKDPVKRWTIPTVMRQSWFTQDYVPVEVKQEDANARFFDEEDPTLAEFMTPDERLVVKESSRMSVSESTHMKPIKQLNAFELINIAAFDVADIFDDDANTVSNATRFTSTEPPERVQQAVCRVAESLNFVSRRQTQARILFECNDLGLVVAMRTYQVVPGVYLYTFSRDEGGREHFHEWFEKICEPSGPVGKMIHVA